MKRNVNANCGNCPYGLGKRISKHHNNEIVDCSHDCETYTQPHVCPKHPNYWGFETAQCGQCAWAGRHIEIKAGQEEVKRAAFCRRVAWAGHVVNVQSNLLEADMNAKLKVSLDTGLVMLDSRACPAFVPRCDEPDAAPCELK